MLPGLLVNESIIHRLTEGDAESVRRLRSIGFTFHWMVERLLSADGAPLVINEDGDLPPGARVERHSVWHWSHRAPRADAVAEWWQGLHATVDQAAPSERARLLAHHVEDAILASALSGEAAPTVYTWHQAQGMKAPAWSRKLMMDRLLNGLEQHGDHLVPLLTALATEDLLTAEDWSPASRARYVQDPVTRLYEAGAWDALSALEAQGAELTVGPTRRPLMDDLMARLRSGSAQPRAGEFLVQWVERQPQVSPEQVDILARVGPNLENDDLRARIQALRRRHQAAQTVADAPIPAATRPRRRS